MLKPTTITDFQALLGETFHVHSAVGEPLHVELELIEVSSDAARRNAHAAGRPFSLIFRAPRTPQLSQGSYALTDLKETAELLAFMVPIADPDPTASYYEIIFN